MKSCIKNKIEYTGSQPRVAQIILCTLTKRPVNVPFIFIPAILVLWIAISAIPWLGGYLSGQVDLRTAVIIFARTSMVGLISSFVASHLMETYSRKRLIPFFFPHGRLVNVDGTFRISIALLDIIIDSIDRFRDGFNLQDDVTLIVVKIGKPLTKAKG